MDRCFSGKRPEKRDYTTGRRSSRGVRLTLAEARTYVCGMMQESATPTRRSYLVLPPSGTPEPSVLDDPASAPRFRFDVSWMAVAETETLPVPEVAPVAPEPVAEAPVETAPPAAAPAPEADIDLEDPVLDEEPEDLALATPDEESTPARRPTAHELAVAVVPSAVGAGLTWFVASETGSDPVTWTALGAAAGFLIGWGCLLWIRRED